MHVGQKIRAILAHARPPVVEHERLIEMTRRSNAMRGCFEYVLTIECFHGDEFARRHSVLDVEVEKGRLIRLHVTTARIEEGARQQFRCVREAVDGWPKWPPDIVVQKFLLLRVVGEEIDVSRSVIAEARALAAHCAEVGPSAVAGAAGVGISAPVLEPAIDDPCGDDVAGEASSAERYLSSAYSPRRA